ncbi:autotransporter beta-domain protein [Chlamydia ibidis]|uniref:Autotransporter beta-domain protein n=2 Tax=Chlamydia ibidis TaxID=1405396 RepID=S7KGY2_9CHLA|nr:polymorphic outer membrane protein middle domain-containing protein [Chlamydia ibidis]EPP35436.1 autotransporter beta-domain protein [Chlamydia ibidis]EQM62929.1 autotransporter beta-domain protein [Chlamydia ibidis 10-1398/6]
MKQNFSLGIFCSLVLLPLYPAHGDVRNTLSSTNNFDGSSGGTLEIKESQGTSSNDHVFYSLSSDVEIKNVTKTNPANRSLFEHTQGYLSFLGNGHSMILSDNTLTNQGSFVKNTESNSVCSFLGFHELLITNTPEAPLGKGAIFSNSRLVFRNNKKIAFDGCSSLQEGGAIHCVRPGINDNIPSVFLQNNGSTIFQNNESNTAGGAIYTDNLAIEASGPVHFIHNTVAPQNDRDLPKGGAIYILPKGTLSLHAKEGSIIFEGNKVIRNNRVVPSSIHLGSEASIEYLIANKGHSIEFYDPIFHDGSSNKELYINKDSQEKIYQGTVLFSSGCRQDGCSPSQAFYLSRILQNVSLAGGTLHIKGDTIVTTKRFSQLPESKIILEQQAKLRADGHILISNLHLPLTTQQLISTDPPSISTIFRDNYLRLYGPIFINIEDENFYDTKLLEKDLKIPLLTLESQELSKIQVEDDDIIIRQDPYGYQGTWTLDWEDRESYMQTPRIKINAVKNAFLSWKPREFRPYFIDAQGNSLVSNSLWSSFTDVRKIHELMDTVSDGSIHNQGIWGAELSHILHKEARPSKTDFLYTSHGYAFGISNRLPGQTVTNLGIIHMSGHTQDTTAAKNWTHTLAGSLYLQHTCAFYPFVKWSLGNLFFSPNVGRVVSKNVPLILTAQATYSNTRNVLSVSRPSTKITEAYWNTHCVNMEGGVSLSFDIQEEHDIFHNVLPFFNIQGIYGYQRKFTEEGVRPHRLSSSQLMNLALPLGMRIEGHSKRLSLFYVGSVSYIFDAYRKNPVSNVLCEYSPFYFWKIYSMELPRQGLHCQVSAHYTYRDTVALFAKGSAELRRFVTCYSANGGMQVLF